MKVLNWVFLFSPASMQRVPNNISPFLFLLISLRFMITKLLIFSVVGLGFSVWVKVLNRVFLSPASMQRVPNKISPCLFFPVALRSFFLIFFHPVSVNAVVHTHEESRLGFGLIFGLWTQV